MFAPPNCEHAAIRPVEKALFFLASPSITFNNSHVCSSSLVQLVAWVSKAKKSRPNLQQHLSSLIRLAFTVPNIEQSGGGRPQYMRPLSDHLSLDGIEQIEHLMKCAPGVQGLYVAKEDMLQNSVKRHFKTDVSHWRLTWLSGIVHARIHIVAKTGQPAACCQDAEDATVAPDRRSQRKQLACFCIYRSSETKMEEWSPVYGSYPGVQTRGKVIKSQDPTCGKPHIILDDLV
ncbi:uncharacterized protein LAESUDRAFT_717760 [Laetiporus sulphureus 93-53]|uniref:Uncharacterized protein n=1 Tax=Laetiporus sulphureus 93-53 TaxID=1314785 RepID=A0A165BHD4_9APHY|nr:uncharacterized protein LAESUDRAFT_717760 [Laetiporus sulphureus 93-53]KZT01058.1 hypothetical protein LAESUDRAFT_717760 [Laetiporus sulphureus 93-53]